MKWISALDLAQWADTVTSNTILPYIVLELIKASSDTVLGSRFPNGDKGQVRGYDGYLSIIGGNEYVPDGCSIWEIGTSQDIKSKLNSDYDKRVAEIPSVERAQMSFVFVSPRTWDSPTVKLGDWVNAKEASGDWAGVKVIDGAVLESWLEACPAVAARHARFTLGLMSQSGARSTNEFWEEYANEFAPPLTEAVVLSGRDKQAEELVTELIAGTSRVEFSADSQEEVVAFAVAAIRNSAEAKKEYLESRVLIIDSKEASRTLPLKNLIYFPLGGAQGVAGGLARIGPTLITAPSNLSAHNSRYLSRPSSSELGKALTTMGFDDEEAIALARRCGRSITILRRMIPGGNVQPPEWVDRQDIIIPALLAGGWEGSLEGDKRAVCELVDIDDYSNYETSLLPLLKLSDPPLDRIDDIWTVRSSVDAFTQLGGYIGSNHLTQFKKVVHDVFGYKEVIEPNSGDLFIQDNLNNGAYSHWLKNGLSNTLLHISALHEQAGLHISGQTPEDFVNRLVKSIPDLSTDPRVLACLRDQLPLIAEAAPIPFLEALEQLLEGNVEVQSVLFNEKEEFFGNSSNHVGLLWALEVLAWDPYLLSRVASILFKLSVIDPGGRLANRPINTLRSIFLAWSPNTNATVKQRGDVLNELVSKDSDHSWALITMLLPKHHDSSSINIKPIYKELSSNDVETLTYGVVWEAQNQILKLAILLATRKPKRIVEIIDSISNFNQSSFELAISFIEGQLVELEGDESFVVWNRLREESAKHHKYLDADWALKKENLQLIDMLVERFKTENPLKDNLWLFNEWHPYGLDDERTNHERVNVIEVILSERGVDGIFDLAKSAELPEVVVSIISQAIDQIGVWEDLFQLTLIDEDLKHFSAVLSGSAANKFNGMWQASYKRIVKEMELGFKVVGLQLIHWPDGSATWRFAEGLGEEVKSTYWKNKSPHVVDSISSPELLDCLHNLIKYCRSKDAIATMHRHLERLPNELIIQILDNAVTEINSSNKLNDQMLSYYLDKIFVYLRENNSIDRNAISRLEWAYLPLIENHKNKLVIHDQMASSPEFFIKFIIMAFKARSEESIDLRDEQKQQAGAAYRLLNSFKSIPGDDGNTLDYGYLLSWVAQTRTLAAETDRSEITDQFIGKLLAHSPIDECDGGWPKKEYRGLIEEVYSVHLGRGLSIARRNMRGVVTKSPYEGGKKEREMAEKYRLWADIVGNEFPHVFCLLNGIAESFDSDAVWSDERAELEKINS